MGIFIIIGIIVLFWLISKSNSTRNNYSGYSGNSNYTSPQSYKKPETKIVVTPPKSISVTPTIINVKPELKLSLVDGQYRVFQNYIINGIQYTYGFPKSNCNDKKVWVGIGRQELERISYQEATYRLKNQQIPSIPSDINNIDNNETYDDYDDDLPF